MEVHDDMNDDPPIAATPLDEQLVAYLDGELDAESSRRIEELLGHRRGSPSPPARDGADVGPVGRSWMRRRRAASSRRRTLEMVAVAAQQGRPAEPGRGPAAPPASLAGDRRRPAGGRSRPASSPWSLCARSQPATPRRPARAGEPRPVPPDRRPSSFSRCSATPGLFSHEAGETPDPAPPPDESLAQRRQRIESMSLSEKEHSCGSRSDFSLSTRTNSSNCGGCTRRFEDAPRRTATPPSHAPLLRVAEDVAAVYADGTGRSWSPADRVESVKKRLKDEHGQRLGDQDIGGVVEMDESNLPCGTRSNY